VIVEVVAECLDVGDNFVPSLSSQMPWEEDKGYIADLAIARVLHTRNPLELKWGVCPKQNLRGILNGSPPCVHEFLDENLAKHPIRFFPENCTEDHGNSVVACLDLDSLFVAVMNSHHLATFANTLGCFF